MEWRHFVNLLIERPSKFVYTLPIHFLVIWSINLLI